MEYKDSAAEQTCRAVLPVEEEVPLPMIYRGSSWKAVGWSSVYAKFCSVTEPTITFTTVLFTAKQCRVMENQFPKIPQLFVMNENRFNEY